MLPKKDKDISPKETLTVEDDIDNLKQFVQKKKNQNLALKKLIDKLNATEIQSLNK